MPSRRGVRIITNHRNRNSARGDDHVVEGRLVDAHAGAITRAGFASSSLAPIAVDRLQVAALQLGLAQLVDARERWRDRAALVAPGQEPARGPAEVVADDEVADPPHRDAQGQRGSHRVGDLEEPVALVPDAERVDDDRPGDAAQQRDAATPDRQHLADVVELGEVGDHVEQPRADDRADQRPEHDPVDGLGGHAPSEAIRPSSHAPTRNPIAMKSPCGEIANESPKRMRSRTGQPMARIEGSTDAESIGGAGIGPLPTGEIG